MGVPKDYKALSVTHMTQVEYVKARWDCLPDESKVSLRGDDDQNLLELQRVFEREYDRKRMILLEGNCHGLTRNYLAAMNALKTVVSGEKAAEIFVEELEKLPEDIGEIPDL